MRHLFYLHCNTAAVTMKRLEAAHHNWQRSILGVTWRDRIGNEEIRRRTGMETMEVILSKMRLQWLGRRQTNTTSITDVVL